MLYDAPVARGYEVLTHSSQRRFAKNGFNQVGNTTLPAHAVGRMGVSSLYNKFLAGISEAGYGRIYPNYGLSAPGKYGRRRGLTDAYINDNPPPGSLRGLRDDTTISPASDFGTDLTMTAETTNAPAPAPTSIWGSIMSDITGTAGSLFGSAVSATTQAGDTAISKAISGGINPPPAPTRSIVTTGPKPASTTILGMSSTALLVGGGLAAYFFMKRR